MTDRVSLLPRVHDVRRLGACGPGPSRETSEIQPGRL